jgi:hypothetical protein
VASSSRIEQGRIAGGGFGGKILVCGGRRFDEFTSKCSGLCGGNPSRRSRFALLRIADSWRCYRLAICDTEFVDHNVISSRSSSSVQRDMRASVMAAPAPGTVPADSRRDFGESIVSTAAA